MNEEELERELEELERELEEQKSGDTVELEEQKSDGIAELPPEGLACLGFMLIFSLVVLTYFGSIAVPALYQAFIQAFAPR